MDATANPKSLTIEYANARSGALLRRVAVKDATLKHSASNNSVVAEYSLPGGRECALFMPLGEGLKVYSTLVAEGRFSIRAQIGPETVTFLASKVEPVEALQFVECVRDRKRLDLAAARASRAAAAAARALAEQRSRDNLLTGFIRTAQGAPVINGGSSGPTRATTNSTSTPRAQLSPEQSAVIDLIARSGASVFFTGGAGTGKSVVLSALKATLPAATTVFTGRYRALFLRNA